MEKLRLLSLKMLFALLALNFFTACEDDTEEEIAPTFEITVEMVENLHAPNDVIDRQTQTILEERPFVRFSLTEKAVEEGNTWDLGFKGTSIIVNGGQSNDGVNRTGNGAAVVYTGIFDELTSVPSDLTFQQDNGAEYAIPKGGGNGWYDYNPQLNLITPIAGRVLIIRLHDGQYAKMEILSYYKDAPANPDAFQDQSATYTFRFALLPNVETQN